MGGGIMKMIMGMLGGGMGGAAGGGMGGGMGGAAGGGMGGDFNTGMQHGMSFGGGGGGSGGVKHAMNTKEIDHQLGLSALQHYKDMSQPHQDFGGMNMGMQFAQMQNPGGPRIQPIQQTQPNAYVQALLSAMHGANGGR